MHDRLKPNAEFQVEFLHLTSFLDQPQCLMISYNICMDLCSTDYKISVPKEMFSIRQNYPRVSPPRLSKKCKFSTVSSSATYTMEGCLPLLLFGLACCCCWTAIVTCTRHHQSAAFTLSRNDWGHNEQQQKLMHL